MRLFAALPTHSKILCLIFSTVYPVVAILDMDFLKQSSGVLLSFKACFNLIIGQMEPVISFLNTFKAINSFYKIKSYKMVFW